jgi:transposase-like protein
MSGMVGVLITKGLPTVTETLQMSYREMERLKIVTRTEQGDLTVTEAAEALGITERQLYRILQRYRTLGTAGLVHRLRGRVSNTGYADEHRRKALRLYCEQYSDYGPTLFVEKLALYHELTVSRQTATRWLTAASLWSGSRKKRPHRKKRLPRSAIGSLIQFDGSLHAWFEDRGPACCLLVAIDDASNRLMLRFAPVEDTHHVLAFWRDYIRRHGIPAEVYTDKGGVYVDHDNPEHLTQVGRAMAALNIRHIKAHSPQAKGRVERANRTLQDRLLKALREHHISSIEQANHFLDQQYTAQHNDQFAHLDNLSDLHRSPDGIHLDNIFCLEEDRHVNYDWTITVHAQYLQLLRSDVPLPPPRSKVTIRHWLDGSLHVFWNEHELAYEPLPCRPHHARQLPQPPPPNHPWRSKHVGGITALRRKEKTLASKQQNSYNASTATKARHSRRQASVRYAHSGFPSSRASP